MYTSIQIDKFSLTISSLGSSEIVILYGSLREKLPSLLSRSLYVARYCKHVLESAQVLSLGHDIIFQYIWCESVA